MVRRHRPCLHIAYDIICYNAKTPEYYRIERVPRRCNNRLALVYRAACIRERFHDFNAWSLHPNPNNRRLPLSTAGTNVSRTMQSGVDCSRLCQTLTDWHRSLDGVAGTCTQAQLARVMKTLDHPLSDRELAAVCERCVKQDELWYRFFCWSCGGHGFR